MADLDIDRLLDLRAKAETAIPGDPMDRNRETGRWEPYFTVHGDPFVVEEGRGQFGTVATVSTAPADYGRARAEFIAACDPETVIALIDEIIARRTPEAIERVQFQEGGK